ncbi:hypothetical protein MS2017_1326 [Bathymodiolus thermophilus thioautotrophic gill symbiont]|uniref:Uncharacterized protein n=1 Tax=Bathymodiolus thermophilus thioautotrophic gill symbiont TaxID=2360 RepID=A0A3G3IMD4_9GAMM|nr:hypothetical protein MS2017_1326 [Bathymodiolus thermophilus thioautotrophic gill symbiont]
MEQIIKNDKHCVETKEYFIRYIKVLLNKIHPHTKYNGISVFVTHNHILINSLYTINDQLNSP